MNDFSSTFEDFATQVDWWCNEIYDLHPEDKADFWREKVEHAKKLVSLNYYLPADLTELVTSLNQSVNYEVKETLCHFIKCAEAEIKYLEQVAFEMDNYDPDREYDEERELKEMEE